MPIDLMQDPSNPFLAPRHFQTYNILLLLCTMMTIRTTAKWKSTARIQSKTPINRTKSGSKVVTHQQCPSCCQLLGDRYNSQDFHGLHYMRTFLDLSIGAKTLTKSSTGEEYDYNDL
mmetsp:Transcript_21286/g.32770  ORF Transcript_21286/g.32770 Transcript_21286/m.32770 type:complete len:117 (+) Transcript_21286:2728-3078(+)